MYENDPESISFAKEISLEIDSFMPKILIHTKMDQIKESKEMIKPTQELAKEMGVQRFFDISIHDVQTITHCVETMMSIAILPSKAFSEATILKAKEEVKNQTSWAQKPTSWLLAGVVVAAAGVLLVKKNGGLPAVQALLKLKK